MVFEEELAKKEFKTSEIDLEGILTQTGFLSIHLILANTLTCSHNRF